MAVDFSPNEEFVLSASLDNSVRVYFAKTGRMKHNLMGHVGRVFTAKFTADSKQVRVSVYFLACQFISDSFLVSFL